MLILHLGLEQKAIFKSVSNSDLTNELPLSFQWPYFSAYNYAYTKSEPL